MRILIDETLALKHQGGMGVYVETLKKLLVKKDRNNEYVFITNPTLFDQKNVFTKIKSLISEYLWYQTSFIEKIQKHDPDIVYSPNPPAPLLTTRKLILTIPDMAFFVSDHINFFVKYFLFLNYYLSAHKATKIITFSKYSKWDISKLLHVNTNKIYVLPLAASKEYRPKTKMNTDVLKRFKIKKDYIICISGTFLPRKNTNDLIKAFKRLDDSIKKNLNLVLVGKSNGEHYENAKRLVKDLNINEQVIFTGYISDPDKIKLIQSSKIYVCPSLYEGFGLPPLEAMQCGIPTIVYNKTSLPEIVGDSGILVENDKQLSKAIIEIISDQIIYNKLKKKGVSRAKLFSWDHTINKFLEIIKS